MISEKVTDLTWNPCWRASPKRVKSKHKGQFCREVVSAVAFLLKLLYSTCIARLLERLKRHLGPRGSKQHSASLGPIPTLFTYQHPSNSRTTQRLPSWHLASATEAVTPNACQLGSVLGGLLCSLNYNQNIPGHARAYPDFEAYHHLPIPKVDPLCGVPGPIM